MSSRPRPWHQRLLDPIERNTRLSKMSEWAEPAVRTAVGQGRRSDALTGRWLGHPVHPMSVTAPISCWIGATVVDTIGGQKGRAVARRMVGLGVLTAAPAALSGAADWLSTQGAERRVGVVHAAGNAAATVLFGWSWAARRGDRHRRGIALSLVGSAVVGSAGYLGGHLAYRRGVGVNTTAFQSGPEEWTDVALREDLEVDEPIAVSADDVSILLVARSGTEVSALENRCTHRGAPLHEGRVVDGCIICPWHESEFDLDSGEVAKGPASMPQPVLDTRLIDGRIEVRRVEDHVALRTNPVKGTTAS